jgi:hypothetical protein
MDKFKRGGGAVAIQLWESAIDGALKARPG